MELLGYIEAPNDTLSKLQEVTFSANSKELRNIAKFLTQCANEIDEHGVDWGHEHMPCDSRVIVFNSEARETP